jgi:hypothetical protein
MQCPEAGKYADRRRAPNRRRSVQPAYIPAILEDDAGTQEADSGDYVGNNTAGLGRVTIEQQTGHHEGCTAGRDEGIRARTGHALTPLSFQTNQGAQKKRNHQAKREL